MVTVDDFRELMTLEADCHIFIDGEEAHGLHYDKELDPEEFIDGCEEMRCTFTFVLDRYTTVQYLTEWTMEKCENVDWRSL